MITPPLSLYVHFPWCVAKCPYCDFNSHGLRGELPEREYVDALLIDLERELARSAPRPIVTVFFGGGTPSLIDAKQVARVIDKLSDRLVRFAATIVGPAHAEDVMTDGVLGTSIPRATVWRTTMTATTTTTDAAARVRELSRGRPRRGPGPRPGPPVRPES